MHMRLLTTFATVAALGVSALGAQPAVPRAAKNFEVVDPNGAHVSLASLKGKVVVVQFLFTTCPHCQAFSQELSKLQTEYGPRGFQAVGLAFNEGVDNNAIRAYDAQNHVNFPIGITPRDTVLGFMDFSAIKRLVVPQIALVDRKGMIIEQTEQDPDTPAALQEQTHLRAAIEKALGPAGAPGKSGPATGAAKKKADGKKPLS
jgi:peroxiredoxin